MKLSRAHIAPLLILTLSIQSTFFGVGCAGNTDESNEVITTTAKAATAAFDGQTLYRGLMFRSGAAAVLVPDMWSLLEQQPRPTSDESIETLRNSAKTMLSSGNTEAAAALNKIADEASNGNINLGSPTEPTTDETIDATIAEIEAVDPTFFARFAAAIQSGNPVKVDAAMTEASKLTMQALSNRINSGGQSVAVDVWYYWDIAVAIEVAAVLIIALVAVFPAIKADSSLEHDQIVKIITKRFYVPGDAPAAQ